MRGVFSKALGLSLVIAVVAVCATNKIDVFVYDTYGIPMASWMFSVIVLHGVIITWLIPKKVQDFRRWRKTRKDS